MNAPRRATVLALATALLVLATVWAAPTPAAACSCVRSADDPELVQRAAVVFTGILVDNQTAGNTRTLTFSVSRVYKGAATATQVVKTRAQGASCGLELTGSGPFLVLAGPGPDPGQLVADACGGTRAGPVPRSLGRGEPPRPVAVQPTAAPTAKQGEPPPGSGAWVPLVGMVLAAGAATLVGASLLRGGAGRPPG